MLYDCPLRIYLDPTETYKCVSMWQGRHAGWSVPASHAGKMLRFSCEIKSIDQHDQGRTPNEGADFYFFVNSTLSGLGKFWDTNKRGLVCGNLGPFQEGDFISFQSFPRNAPTICAAARNFQVCELVGQCPGIVIEGLDISFCSIFGYIGGIFNSVWQFWEDIGDWFEPMWGVGDEIKSFFYAIGGYFAAASGYMWDLRSWCRMLTNYVNDLFNLNLIITYMTDSFAILTYTAGDIVQWISDSLNERFHLAEIWEWITNADNWFAEKIGDVVTLTADTVADMFEEILDRVFKE